MSRTNGYWKKHPKKELQQLLVLFDENGWRIEDPPQYYKVYCPCKMHKATVHLSPSNPNYKKDKIAWLHRQSCYKQAREVGK